MKSIYSRRFLQSNIFKKYYKMLNSSNSRTKIVALQKLEDYFRCGAVLIPSDGDRLDLCLIDLLREGGIGIEEKDAVRRWIYHLCAWRHNPDIRGVCRGLLKQEINFDNKMLIIPVLSQESDFNDFDSSILKLDCGLSYKQLKIAQHGYPGFSNRQLERKLINKLLDENDIITLRFLPTVFNIQPPDSDNRNDILNTKFFGMLANHDDPWVQKLALWTFPKMKRIYISDLNIPPSKFLDLDSQPQKWAMTSMFLDRQFIKQNKDFVGEVLSEHHLLEECDARIKEGIAQGLLRYGYSTWLSEFIIQWYSFEREPAVKILLKSYMMCARKKNKEFDYVLTEERDENDVNSVLPRNDSRKRISTFIFRDKFNRREYRRKNQVNHTIYNEKTRWRESKQKTEQNQQTNSSRRFRVALSFADEVRDFVDIIANRLAEKYCKDDILYDNFHKFEFARVNLDTYLQNLYYSESDLIVVFLSKEYQEKIWCDIEWRAIRSVFSQRGNENRVMFVKCGSGEIDGLCRIRDGVYDVPTMNEKEAVKLTEGIINRYKSVL